MVEGRCDQCGRVKPIVMTTVTGRRLCEDDAAVFNGAALSAMTGGAGGGDVVAGAVNAAGWVRRLRKAMGMGGRR